MSRKKIPKTETTAQQERNKPDEDAWRDVLRSISINDQYWWCIVIMTVETLTAHAQYVSIFNEAAENGKRRTVYALSRKKALSNVRTLSKQSPEKCSVAQHVCHYANKFLHENDESLPAWLMAWIIKYLVYRAKIEMIGRIKLEAELERQIDAEYRIMRTIDTGDLSRNKSTGQESMHLKGKANTRLRRRDEEWRDVVNVDDAPIDGANLYIVLTGFYDPDLPAELVSVGVPLTCILRIKRPAEKLEGPVGVETNHEVFSQRKKAPFLNGQTVSKLDLYRFWTLIEKDLVDPTRMMLYRDVAFLTFCPPMLPVCPDDLEDQNLRTDTYDRVSYIAYDVYDLLRQYSDYLKSMRIVSVTDRNETIADSKIYRSVLDTLPAECVFVPTILYALLLQVEANVDGIESDFFENEQSADLTAFAGVQLADVIEKKIVVERSEHRIQDDDLEMSIQEKLRLLDVQYEFLEGDVSDSDNIGAQSSNIQLILYGDTLHRNTYHVKFDTDIAKLAFPHEINWVYAILRVLQDTRISNLWNYHDVLSDSCKKKYACYLKNIPLYCDPKEQIDFDSVAHYLHMLAFDKMIYDRPTLENHAADRCQSKKKASETYSFTESTTPLTPANNRSNSEHALPAKITTNRHSKSDSDIDYDKPVPELTSASRLFCLTDTRETLVPGYLQTNVFDDRHSQRSPLEEYNDVEFVPKEVFLQTLYESTQTFGRFETSYVEPTDTILLYFANDHAPNDVHLETRRSSIRTPVSFREFAKYVRFEEDWISWQEKERKLEMSETTRELMKSVVERDELAAIFGEEHFILPGSLKAHDLMKRNELAKQRKQLGTTGSARPDESKERKGGKDGEDRQSKEAKRSRKVEVKGRTKETEERGRDKDDKKAGGKANLNERKVEVETDYDTSFLPPRKILMFECAKDGDPYEFVGYDLGKFRVQIVNSTKTFLSADDTLVRIQLDEWLYSRTDLRITVTLRGYDLSVLRNIVGERRTPEMCHLTTKNGIIFAFSRCSNLAICRTDFQRQDLDFDFRASWPSGLLIEPTIGDGPENPFYIRQSYISKGPECADIVHEVRRKFLRNGTVLKYMADGNIVVLRPNGDVVTCTEFNKTNFRDDVYSVRENDELRNQESKHTVLLKTGKHLSKVSKAKMQSLGESMKKNTSSATQQATGRPSDLSASEELATTKVSRYTVLCYDGRHYEVFNDLVVREHDRLLVRTASDYEVDEKFTRRADGTDMLLNSNGELIVSFPDGTRITTGYKIEDEPITCGWTDEDFYRYFGIDQIYEYEDDLSDLPQRGFPNGGDTHEADMTRILIADGFVSVLLTCCMEHKNYATVAYDQTTVNCTLSTPDDLRISISRRGHYEVSMAAEVNLKVHSDALTFSNDVCACCGGKSVSTYKFSDEGNVENGESSRTIFTTVDVFGNVFAVKDDGTTRYRRASQSRGREKSKESKNGHDFWENVFDGEENCDEASEKFAANVPEQKTDSEMRRRDHGRCCERLGTSLRSRYRIFAMNRDFTAYEYLHRSERRKHEVDAVFGDGASAILYPISRRPQLHRLITFLLLQPQSRSKALLQLYRDSVLRSTNHDRTDLLRSTYAIPYHWLFPYGKNGNGIWKNVHDEPLNKKTERHVPETLKVRVLHNFKESNRNAVIDFQTALGRYWMAIVHNDDICQTSALRKEGEDNFIEDNDNTTKNYLRDIALGIQRHIDISTYESGLLKNKTRARLKSEETGKSKRLVQNLERRKATKAEYEWYRNCLRQNVIIPYFESIAGSCFLWIRSCVDKAMKLVDNAPPVSTIETDQSKEDAGADL